MYAKRISDLNQPLHQLEAWSHFHFPCFHKNTPSFIALKGKTLLNVYCVEQGLFLNYPAFSRVGLCTEWFVLQLSMFLARDAFPDTHGPADLFWDNNAA